MNTAHTTLTSITDVHPEARSHLTLDCLALSPAAWGAVADTWQWLRGLAESADAQAIHEARCEAMGYAELILALMSPARDFLHWFRAQPWDGFVGGQDSDDWAWGVIDKVRAKVTQLGDMSDRLSLVSVI
jgi:hypothetical protein